MGEEVQNDIVRGEESAIAKEKETAESVRKRCMDRLAETRERESQGIARKRKKNDREKEAIEYVRGKNDREVNLKREELEVRRKALEMMEKENERQWEIHYHIFSKE